MNPRPIRYDGTASLIRPGDFDALAADLSRFVSDLSEVRRVINTSLDDLATRAEAMELRVRRSTAALREETDAIA